MEFCYEGKDIEGGGREHVGSRELFDRWYLACFCIYKNGGEKIEDLREKGNNCSKDVLNRT